MTTMISCDEAVGNVVATFGSGVLVKMRNGQYQFRGGTRHDRLEAKEWISLFASEIVVDVARYGDCNW
jgi:hypothetical protein